MDTEKESADIKMHRTYCPKCGSISLGIVKTGLDWQSALILIYTKLVVGLIGMALALGLTLVDGVLGIIVAVIVAIVEFILTIKAVIGLFKNCGKVYTVCMECGFDEQIIQNIND